MRTCRCSIVDFRSDGICYQHVFHYGLLQKVLQFGDFVDGYPQSTHKPSTNSIHKFRSVCFYNTLDLWMAMRKLKDFKAEAKESLFHASSHPQIQSTVKTHTSEFVDGFCGWFVGTLRVPIHKVPKL